MQDPNVKNVLIDQRKIESLALSENRHEGEKIMFDNTKTVSEV